jgi:hypothetical protein
MRSCWGYFPRLSHPAGHVECSNLAGRIAPRVYGGPNPFPLCVREGTQAGILALSEIVVERLSSALTAPKSRVPARAPQAPGGWLEGELCLRIETMKTKGKTEGQRKRNSHLRARYLCVLSWNFKTHRFGWSRQWNISETHEQATLAKKKDFAASGFLSRDVWR